MDFNEARDDRMAVASMYKTTIIVVSEL